MACGINISDRIIIHPHIPIPRLRPLRRLGDDACPPAQTFLTALSYQRALKKSSPRLACRYCPVYWYCVGRLPKRHSPHGL